MTPSVPLVRLNQALPITSFLERAGVPCERMLRDAGLPTQALGDPSAFTSAHLIYDFVHRASRSQGIPDLGWRAGLATRVTDLGALADGFLPNSGCVTLFQALRVGFAKGGMESRRLQLWMERSEHAVDLCYSGSLESDSPGFVQVEQYMIALLITMVREAAGPQWLPRTIALRSKPSTGLERVECLSGLPIRTGTRCTSIRVSDPVLRTPLSAGKRARSGGRNDGIDSSPEPGFVASLQTALRPYLCEGAPSVELAARLANTSVRTLQRTLSRDGESYSRLLDELRLRTSLELLGREELKLADVAAELGYADQAHFTRAFRRWTGTPPSQFRRRLTLVE